MELDDYSIQLFATKSMADKAMSTLKGILTGVGIDGIVNDKERIELIQWISDYNSLVSKRPFNEIITYIRDTIYLNELLTTEIIDDLVYACDTYKHNDYYDFITKQIQVLQGICHGILADGVINDDEIYSLKKWLDNNEILNGYFPYDELCSLILNVVKDKIVTPDERIKLMAYFNQFADISRPNVKSLIEDEIKGISIDIICTSNPVIDFKDKLFCITGRLERGNKDEIYRKIVELGGTANDNLTQKTDFLVVANNPNKAWAFACYGRKVAQALEMRKSGKNIVIVHEFDFCDALDDVSC